VPSINPSFIHSQTTPDWRVRVAALFDEMETRGVTRTSKSYALMMDAQGGTRGGSSGNFAAAAGTWLRLCQSMGGGGGNGVGSDGGGGGGGSGGGGGGGGGGGRGRCRNAPVLFPPAAACRTMLAICVRHRRHAHVRRLLADMRGAGHVPAGNTTVSALLAYFAARG
jgi:pentatricopeptide repeat protein